MKKLLIILLNLVGFALLASSGWVVFNVFSPVTPPVPTDVTVLDANSAVTLPVAPPKSILSSSFEPLPAPAVLPETKTTGQPAPQQSPESEDVAARLSQLKITAADLAQFRSQPFPQPAQRVPDRIVLPAIHVDSPVEQVGWKVEQIGTQLYTEWLVADYAVGWHQTSALPGSVGNTVMAGHNNINGEVFKNLIDLKVGDEIFVFADSNVYRYAVAQKLLVRELGASLEQRLQNAQWIAPTDDDRLTLVSCWPYTGNSHRVIIVAKPAGGA